MPKQRSKFPKAYFLKSILLSNFKRLNFPFKLSYAVTYRCNLKCKMCNIWKKSPSDDELTLGEIDNFFKKANKFSWVGIAGGEPFLRTDLTEIIDVVNTYCKRLCVLHFATNGQLTDRIIDLTRYIRKRNKNLKIVYTISIDGPPLLHDEIRGASGAWDKAVRSFKYLNDIDKSVKAHIGFTLSSYNMDKFEDTFISLKEVYPRLKFDDISVNIFQKSSFYYDNQDMRDLDATKVINQIRRILELDKDSLSINSFLKRIYLKFYLRYINTHRCPLKCQALSSTCYLDPYGDLYPCVVYNKKLVNIKNIEGELENIWNRDYTKRLSYECSNYICPSCWTPCDAYSAILGSLKETCLSKI